MMFKRLIRCHVKSSRTPPNKDGTNNKIHLPTKCTTWLFSTISSSSKISTTSDIEASKSTETCLVDNSSKTNNCNETCNLINTQHPNDSQRISCNPYCPDPEGIKLPFIHFTKVRNQFLAIRSQSISSSIKEQLKSHSFNNWLYSDAELINFVKFMFVDLNLPELCHFSIDTLENWIFSTYSRYNNVPFHNFKHAFMVTQMINSGTWLALRYNDISPLENHHCMTAFDLITNNPTANIISGLTPNESRHFRRSVIRCILSTDMAIHSECLSQFQVLRKQVYLNCHDISNEIRSPLVADAWVDCLFNEFFLQAAAEKQAGLPVAPHMDPDLVVKSNSQLNFLHSILIPLVKELTYIFRELHYFWNLRIDDQSISFR
ncbi:putative high-affinity cgmp-specific 3,5-cyclic phosphodiesterase [Schistosoma mansoni]|uniref:putative high-affinity cgmp-specific 3,5-cyclic phosphodiesterase n=1 Tax=Schistosoma mansoni TaxID=6183 RepID=UPI00022DC957|nr:putative high-affinity cgmp-specific 3,5-cyclic phosphodiesterase [Schistosoma mansoni]|eukprot:XP_018647635.1 putative high-affinity cgmp-specific 3,5-cyclic phosphodiesterase [Schistosoma mansoni]